MPSARRVVAVGAAIVLIALLAPVAPAWAASRALGVYAGPAATTSVDAFGAWLGQPPARAVDFIDRTGGFEEIAAPLWQLDAWRPWVDAVPGRKLVLSVPMLPESHWGQLQQGASGQFDGYFRRLAKNMVARNLEGSVIRLGWEANGSWYPWSAAADTEAWKQFFRRIVNTMRGVSGARFTFDWSPIAGPGGTNLSFSSFYPGDDVVDVIGLDVYDIKWQDTTSTPEQRWDFTLNSTRGLLEHRTFANAHGKPVSYGEWGLWQKDTDHGGGGDNPYFIDRMADWFASVDLEYQAYFNYAADNGAALTAYPLSAARYRARFGPLPERLRGAGHSR